MLPYLLVGNFYVPAGSQHDDSDPQTGIRVVFLSQGFRDISVDPIPTQATTTKRTVYQLFKSKEALLLDCHALRIANREAALDARFGETTFASSVVLSKIFEFMESSPQQGEIVRRMGGQHVDC